MNEARPIKRQRATRREMEDRFDGLRAICEELRPLSVRSAFYQAEVAGLVEKTEGGYVKVQRAILAMRRRGLIPYGWITDGTRYRIHEERWKSPADAARATAAVYRRKRWDEAAVHVEVWVDKAGLEGAVFPVADEWDIPIYSYRGQSSDTLIYEAAGELAELDRPCYIYHFGDEDQAGRHARAAIERKLCEMAPGADIRFEHLAVTREQAQRYRLPTRPEKSRHSPEPFAVEVDALSPVILREILRGKIESHVDGREWIAMQAAEESERELMQRWADMLEGAA